MELRFLDDFELVHAEVSMGSNDSFRLWALFAVLAWDRGEVNELGFLIGSWRL